MADLSERKDVLLERQYLYDRYTQPLSGKNRGDLKKLEDQDKRNKLKAYAADPNSRYRRFTDPSGSLTDYAEQARTYLQKHEEAKKKVDQELRKPQRTPSSSVMKPRRSHEEATPPSFTMKRASQLLQSGDSWSQDSPRSTTSDSTGSPVAASARRGSARMRASIVVGAE